MSRDKFSTACWKRAVSSLGCMFIIPGDWSIRVKHRIPPTSGGLVLKTQSSGDRLGLK